MAQHVTDCKFLALGLSSSMRPIIGFFPCEMAAKLLYVKFRLLDIGG